MSRASHAVQFKRQMFLLLALLVLIWGVELADVLVFRPQGLTLDQFGIVPRSIPGLRGILFAPFLHAGFAHLLSNTLPFLILGWLIILRRPQDFAVVSLIVLLVSGLGTWVIGAAGIHLGASGMVFGYLGFLLLAGWFDRRLNSVLLSLTVGVVYGGLLWGVLPNQPGVSWEEHLCGLLGGVLAARLRAPGALLAGRSRAWS